MQFEPTPEQEALLQHPPGQSARVLAGPGTGKSTMMVALLDSYRRLGSAPRTKMLTFTRAATSELAGKLASVSGDFERPRTIHSFAISVLLANPGSGGFPEPLRIADTWESSEVIRRSLAPRVGVGKRVLDKLVAEMASNWQSLADETDPEIRERDREVFRAVWPEHRAVLGYTLLDELPYALRRALHNHDDLQGLDYDVLTVDEYQDLNACDLEALMLVHERSGCSIMAVGDDEQSVYSWRKAAPEGIRRFPEDYPESADYPLSVTLRCGERVIEWANHVIQSDPDRDRSRRPLSCVSGAPSGEVALLSFRGNKSEARGVAALAKALIEYEGVLPNDILVLVRSNYHSQFTNPIKAELEDLGVQCCDPSHVLQVLAEPQNRFFIEGLRILVNKDDSLSWAGILQLTSGVGDGFFDHMYEAAKVQGATFGSVVLDGLDGGFAGAPKSSAGKAASMVQAILDWVAAVSLPDDVEQIAWGEWINETNSRWPFESATDDFLQLMLDLDDVGEERVTLERFLGQVEPLGKDLALARADGVRLMTMVGSKGLTVSAVIAAGVEEGVVPRPGKPMGEECRNLYVAMTRARNYLYCTWSRIRRGPTARAGQASSERRLHSHFLDNGPVVSQDGEAFIKSRFGQDSDGA